MSLSYAEAMAALEAAGTEQTRKTYLRHGAREPLFGVKFGDLRPLAKRVGRSRASLSSCGPAATAMRACWPAWWPTRYEVTEAGLDDWLDDIDSYFLVDTFVAELASKVPGRLERAERWIASAAIGPRRPAGI